MIGNALYSSNRDDWATPQDFYDRLNEEFHFTLDPCASPATAKCAKYYTAEDNGLAQDWGGETVFCNPPYGRDIWQWCRKCRDEARKPNTTVVMLVHARTDTRWFHDFVYGFAELRFVRGRLKFGGSKNSAPFPSMIAIFKNTEQ